MQFLSCKVHFLMIYAHMWPTFGELAGFNNEMDFEIFGLSFTRYGGSPDQAQAVTQIWIRHATLLPKKEKSLNMPAPLPRPRPRRSMVRALPTDAESDCDGLRGSE
jgi:hypothetical protein